MIARVVLKNASVQRVPEINEVHRKLSAVFSAQDVKPTMRVDLLFFEK